jgi:sensor histidine kinase YesM
MKPENNGTKPTVARTISLNDVGFRLLLIPAFGIAIPLLTHMMDVRDFSHWGTKLAYAYTIGIAFVIWQGNRYLLFSLRAYFDWFNKPIRKIIALLLAVTFFTIPISSLLLIGWYHVFNHGIVDWNVVYISTLTIMICVLFITHVYETVFLVKDSESEMIRNEQLERAKAEAELTALKNQIDPHFLFNSLNTLSHLIDEAPQKAKVFNGQLADVYRYILQNRIRNLVPLSDEIDFLLDYFQLLKIRYGDAADLVVRIPEGISQSQMIPPISLQLLVENVFKHNEFSKQYPLQVRISVANDVVVVENTVRKKVATRESSKMGLVNLNERYRLITGRDIRVTAADDLFTVTLPILPIE